MGRSAWIPDYIGYIILDRRLFWIVYRLSESKYNATAISRPFIFDRVEESDCINVIFYLGSLCNNLGSIISQIVTIFVRK